jgi:hypothetical protein
MSHNNSENHLIIACRNCKVNNRVITRKAALAICGNCRWTLLLFNVRIANERNIETSNFLMKRLVELTANLRVLRRDFEYESIDINDAERKLNTCEALTEHLYDYALQHKIHLHIYSEQLLNIVSISQDIADEISRRKRLANLKKRRWKNSLNAVVKVTNFVMLLLGLPAFLHPLPEERRLLTSASYKELHR